MKNMPAIVTLFVVAYVSPAVAQSRVDFVPPGSTEILPVQQILAPNGKTVQIRRFVQFATVSGDNTIQVTQGDIATLYIVLQYPLEADPIVFLGGEAFAGRTGFDLLLADGTTYLEPDFVDMTLGADWRSSEEIGVIVDIVEFGRLLLQAYALRRKAIAPLIRELRGVLLDLAANYTNDILFQNNCAIGNLPDQTPWRTAPNERRRTTLIPGVDYLRFQGYRYAFPILFDESGSKTIDFIVRTGVSHNQSLLPQNLCATNAFNVNVAPNSGTIDIRLTGTNSGEVFIDGESVGTGSRLVGKTPGTHTVTFGAVAGFVTPAPRTVTVSRDQTITVTGTYADNAACTYTMRRIDSPQTHPFDGGDDFSLQLETLGPQCQWSVTTDAPWITINGGLTGGVGGSPIIRYTVNENPTVTPRTGHVIFQGNTSLESTITQAGAPCFIEIDPSELARTHDSGTDNGALSVYSPLGCSWAVKNDGALNDWLTLDLDTSGDGGGTILYALAENTTASTRTVTIEIGDPTKPTVQRFTVTQLANTCGAPLLSSSATNIPSPTFTGSVLVTTDAGCSWSAESSASWLSIDPNTTSSISGGGVIYNVQQNPSTSSRVATLTIAEQTFTVTQDADSGSGNFPPRVEITPNGQTVEELTLVTLNGSASSDFETPFPGLRFQWTQLAGAVGVTINDSDRAVASFLAPDLPHPSSEPLIFELAVDDGSNTSTDTTTVTVTSVPDSEDGLIARNDLYIVAPGSSNNSLDVSSNDTPSSGVTIAIASDPALGTARVSGNAILYSPTAPSGSDAFTYTIGNDLGTSAPALVTVNIGEDFAVFVGNAERDEILYWSSLGDFLGTFASRSNGNLGLNAPDSLTFDDPPLFLHAGSGSLRTFRFDARSGDDAGSGNDSIFVDSLSAPVGDLAVASDGRLYFTLPASNEIRYADAGIGGRFSFQHAKATDGLSNPDGMVFHSGSLYVANTGDHRILEISLSGNVREFVSSRSGGLSSPHDLAFGSDGHLYVLSSVTETVYRFDGSSGAPLSFSGSSATALFTNHRNLDDPTTIAASPDRRLFVGNGGDENILVIGIPSSNTTPVVTEFVASRSQGLDDILAVAIGPAPVPNAAPALDPISNRTMFEGSSLSVDIQAIDLNDDPVDLSATGLPPFATLTDNGDGTGSIAFNPSFVSANSYDVTVVASDGDLNDSASFRLTVLDVNQPPTIDPIGPRSVDEGGTLSISITARDADIGDTLSFSASGLPGFATLSDHGNRIATVTLNPGFADAGPYEVTIRVVDNGLGPAADMESFTLSVIHVNEAPTVADQALSVDENRANGTFIGSVSASDSDAGDVLTFDVTGGSGSTAFDVDAGSGAIIVADSLQLDFESARSLTLQIVVTDSGGLTDSALVTVNVNNINEAPTANDQSFTADENAPNGTSIGTVAASDPDAGDAPSFEITGGSGSTAFEVDAVSGAMVIADSQQLDFEAARSSTVEILVTDRGGLTDTAVITVNLNDINEAPTANDDSVTVDENDSVVILLAAFDPENDALKFEVVTQPDNGSLTGEPPSLTYSPSPGFAGEDSFDFKVNDGKKDSNIATVSITVIAVNEPPFADAGPDENVETGSRVTLDGSNSFDPDGDLINFDWTIDWRIDAKPEGSLLADRDIEGRTTPNPSLSLDVDGVYVLRLIVNDGELNSEPDFVELIASTLNVPPNTEAGDDLSVSVGETALLDGSASEDPDGDDQALTYLWSFAAVPFGSNLVSADIEERERAQARFQPDVAGDYLVTLRVSDATDSSADNVLVSASLVNVAPNARAGEDQMTALGDAVSLDGTASNDPDEGPRGLVFSWRLISIPAGSALTNSDLVDSEMSTAFFVPDAEGAYVLELEVFDGEANDFDNVMIRVARLPDPDLNNDGIVSILDVSIAGSCYGQTPPATPHITITTPVDSSVLSSTAVTVSGTVIGDDVIVEVNGVIATVAGNLFTAADIPLSEGPNTILVTATTRADRCLAADTNGDQLIDLSDFSFVIASFGQSGFPTGEPVRNVATGRAAVRVRVDLP